MKPSLCIVDYSRFSLRSVRHIITRFNRCTDFSHGFDVDGGLRLCDACSSEYKYQYYYMRRRRTPKLLANFVMIDYVPATVADFAHLRHGPAQWQLTARHRIDPACATGLGDRWCLPASLKTAPGQVGRTSQMLRRHDQVQWNASLASTTTSHRQLFFSCR